jgi:hypothetical protein
MTVSEEDEHMGWDIEEQSGTSVHNCRTSFPLVSGLHSGRSGSFEHFDFRCLVFERVWGTV